MQDFVPGVLIIFYVYIVVVTSSLMINIGESQRIFNVVDYGAVGDGQTDDSTILGKIVAPASIQAWKDCKSKCWLRFDYVNGLIMRGSGTIDGRGSAWWKDFGPGVLITFYVYIVVVTSSLMINIGESQRIFNVVDYGAVGDGQTDDSPILGKIVAPASIQAWKDCKSKCWLRFDYVNGLIMRGSGTIDGRGSAWWKDFGPGVLITFYVYIVVVTSSLMINIGESQRIFNVVDYGAVGDGQTDDSPILGKIVAPASIQAWKDCKSKCWLWFNYVNGLIMRGSGTIDGRGPAWWKTDSIQVNYVSFVNVHGTSASEQAITLDCSSSVKGCTNIVMKQVNITSSKPGNEIRALCKNAHGIFESTTPHVSCS
ncbi:hypothetical protein LWI29_023373 [Acer saccharum]|uniref:Polygalacturonase n=1 Tax=Acer saccharum TaxID=4024 RepID=A0AA39RG96_ACESA|nr:hypothetical protein LWI29_023373 [Acer saccharum]